MPTRTGNQSDRELLEVFAGRQDEAAFVELVRRYGPMVLGVCRKMLRHEQDAEDAFQATFLVLARKSGSIRDPEALPNWLYGVACRLAARARVIAARRQAREAPLEESLDPAAMPEPDPDGVGPVLYEEIGRLPDHYRAPFVLCYLQGRTNEEAARQLGCAPGTVFSRLARARNRLRSRLERRGVVFSWLLLPEAASPFPRETEEPVPPELEAATVRLVVPSPGDGQPGTPVPPRIARLVGSSGVFGRRGCVLAVAAAVLLLTAAALLLAVAGGAQLRTPPAEKTVQERLQGTWDLQALNVNGRAVPDLAAAGLQAVLRVQGPGMAMNGGAFNLPGVFQIEPDTHPVHLIWTVNGNAIHGIVELRTPDDLVVCTNFQDGRMDCPGNKPPSDFTPGPGKSVMVYRRARP
jgi:RNA polymerase sigma factor (sigma-70 family)